MFQRLSLFLSLLINNKVLASQFKGSCVVLGCLRWIVCTVHKSTYNWRAQTSACLGMKTTSGPPHIGYLHHRFLHSDSWLSFKRLFYVFAVEKDIFVADFLSKNRRGLCPTLSFVRKAIGYFYNYMIDRMYNTISLAAHLCYFITIPSQLPAYNQNYIVFPSPFFQEQRQRS